MSNTLFLKKKKIHFLTVFFFNSNISNIGNDSNANNNNDYSNNKKNNIKK